MDNLLLAEQTTAQSRLTIDEMAKNQSFQVLDFCRVDVM